MFSPGALIQAITVKLHYFAVYEVRVSRKNLVPEHFAVDSCVEVAAGMEPALQALAAQTAASAQQIQQMTEAIRQSATSSSDRTQGMVNLFECSRENRGNKI